MNILKSLVHVSEKLYNDLNKLLLLYIYILLEL
jgi:hypothetical protein